MSRNIKIVDMADVRATSPTRLINDAARVLTAKPPKEVIVIDLDHDYKIRFGYSARPVVVLGMLEEVKAELLRRIQQDYADD